MLETIAPYLRGRTETVIRGMSDDLTTQRIQIRQAEASASARETEALELASIVRKASARIRELEKMLSEENSVVAGLSAQRDTLMEALPKNHPLLSDSGNRFKKSGNVKTRIRLIFEAAFDKMARSKGITNPAGCRLD
jgi:uncharacterized coiled-coil protein SlyX